LEIGDHAWEQIDALPPDAASALADVPKEWCTSIGWCRA